MVDISPIDILLKVAGEDLAQSRQWETIGFSTLGVSLAILGVFVANKDFFQGVSRRWSLAGLMSIAGLVLFLVLASIRHLLVATLYFHYGETKINIAQAACRGDSDYPVATILNLTLYDDGTKIKMYELLYHAAILAGKWPLVFIPPVMIVVTSTVLVVGQWKQNSSKGPTN